MFENSTLKNILETSSTVDSQSAVLAEWNLNSPDNILEIGNYRYRPNTASPTIENFGLIKSVFIKESSSTTTPYYYGATDADVTIDGGYDADDVPLAFTYQQTKNKLIYSLEDCFGRFRPRSGINKAIFFSLNNYLPYSDQDTFARPRYYMADKDDKFKYWTSFRTESVDNKNIERGVSKNTSGTYYIDDAAPFIVYENAVPANRIVVKMQTNVGTIDKGTFINLGKTVADPFYGDSNKTTPVNWKIQTLQNGDWIDAITFDANSKREDDSAIIKEDGYLELAYGLTNIPSQYKSNFVYAGTYSSASLLPTESIVGYAYLVKATSSDLGTFYVWQGINGYTSFVPSYGWYVNEEALSNLSAYETELVSPESYVNGTIHYRGFQYLQGLRIVVDTMNKEDCTFDLIELSPRLAVNITDRVRGFSVTKTASDLGLSGMPVGQLLASVGDLSIFDYDNAFSDLNKNSILNIKNFEGTIHDSFSSKNLQIKFYEIIYNNGEVYCVPIKTMYSEGFPQSKASDRSISITLRDLFFYFESMVPPQILVPDVSLSYAISLLFDSIGFSNYKFYRNTDEPELIIPYFYVGPDTTSVAQVLQNLAQASQSAMFFDEYNNFVVMSKNYFMPTDDERLPVMELNGSAYHPTDNSILANIVELSSKNANVYNDGRIVYSTKYIQKSYGSLSQASYSDANKVWVYKPALLWEISSPESVRSQNEETTTQSSYALTAIPLASTLTSDLPIVDENGKIQNNVVEFGENAWKYIARHNGYLYANGEIIRYDAIEYSVSGVGNVWISSVQEYQKYFAKMSFNGKIFPTGRIRIYSEPFYDDATATLKVGKVSKHGRGQFGTSVATHNAGLSSQWSSKANAVSCQMDSSALFQNKASTYYNDVATGTVSDSSKLANSTGIIKNFVNASSVNVSETALSKLTSVVDGTVQSSALVMSGPNFASSENALDYISYTYKNLDSKFVHYGTRMRIVGSLINDSKDKIQSPIGSYPYYTNIGGAGGGIAIMVNPKTNNGYYFEIAALTDPLTSSAFSKGNINNVFFYKIASGSDSANSNKAVPVNLWQGLTSIMVDPGTFPGQSRFTGDTAVPSVYDLAVEYEKTNAGLKFYLYINDQVVAVVEDQNPLSERNTFALFTRGSGKVMFENVYALSSNYSHNTQTLLNAPVNSVFSKSTIATSDSFRKYAISGIIQDTFLSGITAKDSPSYNMYFEEFGTVMREAAYFNIKYDKAYPALYAKMSPTFSDVKGYTISGFNANAYGAEFLIFNNTDNVLTLDESSGNYLRIQGITFTQQSEHQLTVDEFFAKNSDLSSPTYVNNKTINVQLNKIFNDLRTSRTVYGSKDFTLNTPYIQTQDAANELMGWMISKIMHPRLFIGLGLFATPIIQLGDIVSINYKDEAKQDIIPSTSKFVVYSIEYKKSENGPVMNVYLSEVK